MYKDKVKLGIILLMMFPIQRQGTIEPNLTDNNLIEG